MKKLLLLIAIALSKPTVCGEFKGVGHSLVEGSGICRYILYNQRSISQMDIDVLGEQYEGVSANSFWFSAPNGITVAEFISKTDSEIRSVMARNLEKQNVYGSSNVLIDMEYPVHPKNFGKYREEAGEKEFRDLVFAFKKRIDIARELLPDARLGLYGIPTPTGAVRGIEALNLQMSGIQAAGSLGMFDSLDSISPTLYFRYGEDDWNHVARIENMTKAGIKAALQVRKSDGSPIDVIPLFSHKTFNGRSANHRDIAPVYFGDLQLNYVQDVGGVSAVAYWSVNNDKEMKSWLLALNPYSKTCR